MSWAPDLQSAWHCYVGKYFTNKTILDVGAGQGLSKQRLGNNIIKTQDNDRSLMNNVDFICPIEELLTREDRYDIVASFDVIEHVYNPIILAKQLYALSKIGVFITTPNYKRHPHPWHYKAEEFIKLCDDIEHEDRSTRYFMRQKQADNDDITEISIDEFINNNNIYAFGLFIYRKKNLR